LAWNPDPKSDLVAASLDSPDPVVRKKGLFRIMSERRVDLIGKVKNLALTEKDEEFSVLATQVFLSLENFPPIPEIDKEIENLLPKPEGIKKITPKCWEYLSNAGKKSILLKVLATLENAPLRESLNFLENCLRHVDPEVRAAACKPGASSFDPYLFLNVLVLTCDSDERVSLAAFEALRGLSPSYIEIILDRIIKTKDSSAIKTLGPFLPLFACPETQPFFKKLAEEKPSPLISMKSKEALEKIEKFFKTYKPSAKTEHLFDSVMAEAILETKETKAKSSKAVSNSQENKPVPAAPPTAPPPQIKSSPTPEAIKPPTPAKKSRFVIEEPPSSSQTVSPTPVLQTPSVSSEIASKKEISPQGLVTAKPPEPSPPSGVAPMPPSTKSEAQKTERAQPDTAKTGAVASPAPVSAPTAEKPPAPLTPAQAVSSTPSTPSSPQIPAASTKSSTPTATSGKTEVSTVSPNVTKPPTPIEAKESEQKKVTELPSSRQKQPEAPLQASVVAPSSSIPPKSSEHAPSQEERKPPISQPSKPPEAAPSTASSPEGPVTQKISSNSFANPKASFIDSILSRYPSFISSNLAPLFENHPPLEHLKNLKNLVGSMLAFLNFCSLQTYLFYATRVPKVDEIVLECLKAHLLGQTPVRFLHNFSLAVKGVRGNDSFFTFGLAKFITETSDQSPSVVLKELFEFAFGHPEGNLEETLPQAVDALSQILINLKGIIQNRIVFKTSPGAREPFIDLTGPKPVPLAPSDRPGLDLPAGEAVLLSKDRSEALGLFPFFEFDGNGIKYSKPDKAKFDMLLERLELKV